LANRLIIWAGGRGGNGRERKITRIQPCDCVTPRRPAPVASSSPVRWW